MIGQLAKTPVTYERVTDMGESMGFKVGHATVMDLTVGWDFTLSEHREIVREFVKRTRPKLLIGSPMVSFLNDLSKTKRC